MILVVAANSDTGRIVSKRYRKDAGTLLMPHHRNSRGQPRTRLTLPKNTRAAGTTRCEQQFRIGKNQQCRVTGGKDSFALSCGRESWTAVSTPMPPQVVRSIDHETAPDWIAQDKAGVPVERDGVPETVGIGILEKQLAHPSAVW